jgi:hypothetical protein
VERLSTLLACASLLCFLGCASEGPTGPELQEQLRKGVSGEGQITEDVNRSDDPYVKPREGRPGPRD